MGLGAAAAAILDGKLPGDAKPILARRKAIEQSIADAKRQEREEHELARAKKAFTLQPHKALQRDSTQVRVAVTSPSASHDPVLEKKLKKIATQGIVALFNAVRQAQGTSASEKVRRSLSPTAQPSSRIMSFAFSPNR